MTRSRFHAVEELRAEHLRQCNHIRARLQDFASVPPDAHFYELAYCLLTPQSSAQHADSAVQALQALGFRERGFDPTPILRKPDTYIRFHNTKARRLLDVRDQFPDITARLGAAQHARGDADVHAVREWLVHTVSGLGMKEASHFLRNIGFRNLAILDRHILKNLRYHGVLRTIPTTVTSRRYHAIEDKFLGFAGAVGIPIDELDLLFWSRETGEIRK
jgi:N-glycosylase/DNA lyase